MISYYFSIINYETGFIACLKKKKKKVQEILDSYNPIYLFNIFS